MKLSIITPSFNQGRYIERTIQSVLASHTVDLEYIVMDGGSQDETVSILKKYSDRLQFFSEKDDGQAHAVNKGLKRATGEVIGWLNSDDVYCEGALKKIMDCFQMKPEIDVLYGGAHHIDENGALIEVYPTRPWHFSHLMQTCYLSQPAVFFRRVWVDKIGLLNENLQYCMDYEYWLRLAMSGANFYYLDDILAGSRLYPDTKTLRAPYEAAHETVNMLRETLGFVSARWLMNEAVAFVKKNTAWRLPDVRFIFSVWALAARNAFKCNGPWRGLLNCIQLPVLFINRRLT